MKSLITKPKNAKIFVQRVKVIFRDNEKGFIFPLKEQYAKDRRTINISQTAETVVTAEAKADNWLIHDQDDTKTAVEVPPEPKQTPAG